MFKKKNLHNETSWQGVSKWYNQSVAEDGNYYHQHVVIPESLRLLNIQNPAKIKILDLACGQGVLERTLPKEVQYVGADLAPDLIAYAAEHRKNPAHQFITQDVARSFTSNLAPFTHASCILALQNIRQPEGVMGNAAQLLTPGGKFVLVLNHPCFRIPRQSSWGVDESKKTQYRRIDRYVSEMEIPITAHPGQKNSKVTWSFHKPLAAYFQLLSQNGFLIENIEEWTSDKVSQGKAAKMENRGRQEFPLFLAILAQKKV